MNVFYLIAFVGILVVTVVGCDSKLNAIHITYRNNSNLTVWVETAKIFEGDVACGNLKPGAEASLSFPRPKEVPTTIAIEWWEGGRERPKLQDQIETQEVDIPLFDETVERWNLFLELGADKTWRVSNKSNVSEQE